MPEAMVVIGHIVYCLSLEVGRVSSAVLWPEIEFSVGAIQLKGTFFLIMEEGLSSCAHHLEPVVIMKIFLWEIPA